MKYLTTTPSTQQQQWVQNRFANLSSDEYREQIQQLQAAGEKITNEIAQQVEDRVITPLQGLVMTGAVQSSLYGFHGRPTVDPSMGL